MPHLCVRPQLARTLACVAALVVVAGAPAEKVSFNEQIRPILSKNCFACHGPDPESRQAGVQLDTHAAATGQAGGMPAIIPGDSKNSRIVVRMQHPQMPMPPSGDRLDPEEIELVKQWIDEGAEYDTHWAFVPPLRPEPPSVQKAGWARNPIDHFVLARLEREGLEPAKEADRRTLIRRVSLDLIGLPPTSEEVEAFVNDESETAYEDLVDRLLNSKHYGERWARVWLDLARYADSKGYEADRLRTIWPYRDWVIKALNDNIPFDRFTILQLAGDLLPVPTEDQLIATGFHRNTMTNDEGGTDNEEYRDMAVKDRVATTGQVWMGLTVGCAQCHTHKYDPISHEEFYQLYAFFNQSADEDDMSDKPVLELEEDLTTLIMQDLPPEDARETHIHNRGNFMDPGKAVHPATPEAFPPLPEGAPNNRLGLAKWLVNDDNPLTARVTVNRFWARLFGSGIVETEEDFGNQGTQPSHPLLLDWLATEFMRLDWDMKGALKTIVMSATYRQDSAVSDALLEKDPYNRLLARGPRVRLPAEMIRDQMLTASGLLSDKMYGPPVMPLQPDGVWQVVYSGDRWETSDGDDRYRRALYTMWRRTSPYPAMTTFDAPTGEVCTLRRIRTNTPLQALVALNDPLSLEAAQHLAANVSEKAESDEDAIERLYLRVLARAPTDAEMARTKELYAKAENDLEGDHVAARQLLNVDRIVYEIDRRTTLLPLSRDEPQMWRYTTERPGEDWATLGYKDKKWEEGEPIFGYIKRKKDEDDEDKEKDPRQVRTPWRTRDIWLRKEIELADADDLEKFRLDIDYRGQYEVFINGVRATAPDDDTSAYKELRVEDEAAAALRTGRNVIAVHAEPLVEGDGNQFVDLGLRALIKPDLGRAAKSDPSRAAWVVVAHVLLNLDETLTKR